ncbi:MAG: IPTL-CTERM sorting domain-containing protein [Acidobacteriota bacterium]
MGHSWALVAGEPDLTLGVTSRIEVTVTVDNPTAFPIQFDAATAGTDVLTAVVPTNGGQTVYVTGSATITGGTSTATAETGTGPWNLTFAPGVIAAGTTATLTYRIDVTPSGLGTLDITGAGLPTGTQGTYLDETCADAGGGSSACSAAAQTTATFEFGPLCELSAPVTGSVGAAKRVNSGPTDNLDGTFTVGFEILVENLGTEDLDMVQVVDNLATTFPSPATVTSVSAVVVTGTLVANGSFNGIGDTNLLDASMSTLAVGMTATASFTVTFDPNGLPGPFFNQATVSGDTPGGSTVTDPSDNGTDPDPNGNGNANEAGENDPTPIVVPENPSITVVKTAGAVTDAPTPGLFDVTYTLVTTNVGNVDLSSVQVTDDLSLTFPAPASVVSAGANCTAGSCGTVTVDYTGPADTTLLDASMSTLAVGASFTLELTVRFDPNGEAGPFSNQATSSGTSPQGSTVQDSDTASTAVSENPAITVAKTVATPMDVGGGAFTVVYSILATNTGNVDLDMLQLTDNLLVAFPAPANIVAASALCTAGSCGTVTVDFINPADTTLLDASASSLAVGQSVTIELTVTFNTGGGVGPFTNMVTASATSPLDANVQDDDDVDFSLGENPAISIVKTAGPVTDAPMLGEFDVTFTLVVTNTGDVNLTSLQVIDPIDLPFLPGDAVSSSVTCVAGSCGTVTIEYGGPVDFTLLDETMSSLAVGQSVTFELMARFRPFQFPGPFTNFASASGDSPLGTTVTDQDDADAAVPGNPGIDVVKTLDSLVDEGGGVFTATFSVDVSNTGNVLLLDVEILDDLTLTFPPPIVIQTVTPPTGGINLPPNPNFDGVGDTNLIAASPNPLLLNFTETFTFSVTFDRAGEPGPLDNVATGSGDSPQGVNVQDSDDAQITLPPVPAVPVIGLAKAVDGPVIDNGDGTLSVPFLFTVDNFGDVDLFDVQVTDDLSLTFPPPASVVSVTAPVASITVGTGALAANAAFDGVGDTDLLVAAGSTLDVGASGEIRFEVTFDPADETSFENSAIATADSADGPTSDTSDDGTNSDTDGDGNPDEDGENDPTPIELMPNPIEIPTLGPWGLVSLVSLLALLGVGLMRRRI